MSKTILVVEDEMSLRHALVEKLQHVGYQTLEAEDGAEGVEQTLRKHPDLLLLDLMMPKMGGMEALAKIRADAWGKGIPVIILTNIGDTASVEAAMERQSFDYLVKSDWKIEDVVAKVREKIGGPE